MDAISVLIIDADEANRNFLAQLLQKELSCKARATGEEWIQVGVGSAAEYNGFRIKICLI